MSESTEFTYFIQGVAGGPIKIGFTSTSPERRLRALQTGSPIEMKLLGHLAGNRERELHDKFSHLRLHGEWFDNTPELLNYLACQLQDAAAAERLGVMCPASIRRINYENLFDKRFTADDDAMDLWEWAQGVDFSDGDPCWQEVPADIADEGAYQEWLEWYVEEHPHGIIETIIQLLSETPSFFEEVLIASDLKLMWVVCGPVTSKNRLLLLGDLSALAFCLDCTSSPWDLYASAHLEGIPVGIDLVASDVSEAMQTFDIAEFFERLATPSIINLK